MAKTILLADDSVTIQKVVELTFMDQDYQVVATGDGTSALEQLPELHPDLVIADVHMPGADGYEVCRQTKEAHPDIPVLLLVGTFEQFDEAKAGAVGADGHLKKPFDSQDLLSQVDTLIASFGKAEPAAEAAPPADADVFATDVAQPLDLEPPILETSAAPAGDVWGAGLPEAEAVPVAEPEASAFTTTPSPGFSAPLPVTDLDQDVTETAAVDLDAVGMGAPVPEAPAAGLEPSAEAASTDELPAAPEPAAPAFDLEAPSLEAPPIEDFAPFDDPPVAEAEPWAATIEPETPVEPVVEASAEESFAIEPFPVMAEEPAVEEPAVEESFAEELAAEEPTAEIAVAEAAVAEEPVVEEPAAAMPTVEEPAVEEPAVEEPVAAESAAEVPAAAGANGSGPLSDDDVERIARRVAELVGKEALRDVAWEVLPDLAEVIIKERIRELESQVV